MRGSSVEAGSLFSYSSYVDLEARVLRESPAARDPMPRRRDVLGSNTDIRVGLSRAAAITNLWSTLALSAGLILGVETGAPRLRRPLGWPR